MYSLHNNHVFTAKQSSPEKLVLYFRYHSSIKCQIIVFHICSNRFPYPYNHPKMVVWPETSLEGHLNRDHGCGIIHVQRQQYSELGTHLQELNASDRAQGSSANPLHINVWKLQAIWLGLQAFKRRLNNTYIALMVENIILPLVRQWAKKSGITLVPAIFPVTLECVYRPSVIQNWS